MLCGFVESLSRFTRDEQASTAIEYGLIAACIALAITASLSSVADGIRTGVYEPVAAALSSVF